VIESGDLLEHVQVVAQQEGGVWAQQDLVKGRQGSSMKLANARFQFGVLRVVTSSNCSQANVQEKFEECNFSIATS
jgi:hypothetical protein